MRSGSMFYVSVPFRDGRLWLHLESIGAPLSGRSH